MHAEKFSTLSQPSIQLSLVTVWLLIGPAAHLFQIKKVQRGFFLQGEQCNIVPDNVDDIVADLVTEEKEEGKKIIGMVEVQLGSELTLS